MSGRGLCVCLWGGADLQDDVSQQPQVAVPHGPGADQDLRVVAVVPLVVDGHDDPAETHGQTWFWFWFWWTWVTQTEPNSPPYPPLLCGGVLHFCPVRGVKLGGRGGALVEPGQLAVRPLDPRGPRPPLVLQDLSDGELKE